VSTPSLAAEVRLLVADLERRMSGDTATPAHLPQHPWLATLAGLFGLDAFETAVLALAFAVTTVPAAWAASRALGGGAGRGVVDPLAALALWPDGDWAAFTPDSPLLRWRLLLPDPDRGLILAEPVLAWLLGRPTVDARLRCRTIPSAASPQLAASQTPSVDAVVAAWPRGSVGLCGADPGTRRAVAEAAAARMNVHLIRVCAADLPGSPEERHELVAVWERDARLCRSALLVEVEDARAFTGVLDRLRPTPGWWFSSAEPLPGVSGVPVFPPTTEERHAAWSLLAAPGTPPAALDGVASQFVLGIHDILSSGAGDATPAQLWDGARRVCRGRMEDLAQRIEPRGTWEELVVPDAARQTLRSLVAHVRHRHRVQEEWGFSDSSSRGLGITALFHGPSGTGKTMAAEVVAGELRLDLYRIDLSSVVSKYIGETEKHLRRLFDAAEAGSAVLLFDEADALFGKRSEVRDSHDRYANIEVGYLLTRMECYRGLAILTTNLKDTLDPAFQRRLRFVVGFSSPDAAQRLRIWEHALPDAVPRERLDYGRLARLELSGANIRNVALHAAFLAADAGERVGMRHIASAARDELVRLGRPTHDLRTLS
jgi:AAA+ superfamily predicted ATPase